MAMGRVGQDIRLYFLMRILSILMNDLITTPLSYLFCLIFFLFQRLSTSHPHSASCCSLATSRILRHHPLLSHPYWPLCHGLLANQIKSRLDLEEGDFRRGYHFQDDVCFFFLRGPPPSFRLTHPTTTSEES